MASSEWVTLAQDRAGWLKLVTKLPFDTLAKCSYCHDPGVTPKLRIRRCGGLQRIEFRNMKQKTGNRSRKEKGYLSLVDWFQINSMSSSRFRGGVFELISHLPSASIQDPFAILNCAKCTRAHFWLQHWLLNMPFGFVLGRVRLHFLSAFLAAMPPGLATFD